MQKSSRDSKRERSDPSLLRPLPQKFPIGIFFLILFALMTPQPVATQTSARLSPPPDTQKTSLSREDYVGDEACRSCHEKESAAYPTTAHHLTSRVADAHSISGSFDPANNTFQTANPALSFKMSASENGYYQTAVDQISPDKKIELTERFDLVIGSNRKAQTYLYWKGNELFELPVSWWAKPGQWINSPGYEDGAVRLNRPIVPRCLECHGSFFQSLAPPSNRYNRASLVLGIACEKCHGPGREHVTVYRSSSVPKPAAAKAVINPATFSRNRQVDACALCHAGTGEPLAPALSFKPGDTLGKYLRIPEADPVIPVDVHGNQVQLLKRSRCYQSSNMTCSTCHNVHQEQHDVAEISRSCLSCHQAKQCGKFTEMGEQITRDCIDCHMPVKKSVSLFSDSGDRTLQLPVRDHRIAIYRNLNEVVQLP